MKNLSKICLIISALILIFTLLSCQNSYTDTSSDTVSDTDISINTDSENPPLPNIDEPIYNDGKLIITNTENIEFYPTYNLGNYFGNGFKNVYDDFEGKIEYEIMQDYDETKESTDYGEGIDEKLFETHYIVVLKLPESYPKKYAFLGIKEFKKEGSVNIAEAVYAIPNEISDQNYHYIAVPQSHLENWDDEGIIEMIWEEINYINYRKNIEVDLDFCKVDGYTEFLTRSQLETYIRTKNLPVNINTIGITPYYLVCFSKGNFDKENYVKPTYNNGIIEIIRDFTEKDNMIEKASLSIIPINISAINSESDITEIKVTLRKVDYGTPMIKNYSINHTVIKGITENLYTAFSGGVFYGLDFMGMEKSAYTVIETYEEMKNKTEFLIDEKQFEDNAVIVLRLVGAKSDRVGFCNLSNTENGIEITAYICPNYKYIQSGFKESEQIEDLNKEDENKVEYEYIIVPKTHLSKLNQKTGYITLNYNLTFDNYNSGTNIYDPEYLYTQNIYFCNYDLNLPNKSESYQIKSTLQMYDFLEKYGLSDTSLDFRLKEGQYIVIYLENFSVNNIVHTSVSIENHTLNLSYIVTEHIKNNGEKLEGQGNALIFIETKITEEINKVEVEYYDINYTKCNVIPSNEDITTYDFHKIELYEYKPNWKYKLISDYQTLQDIITDCNGYNDLKESLNEEPIFDYDIFNENYVLALYITEGNSSDIKNTFYNARVNADKNLYLCAFESSEEGCDAIYEMLYLIVIPKTHITEEIKSVIVQTTDEIVYNGPFDRIEKIRVNVNNDSARLEKFFAVINSYDEYETLFPDYEIANGINFEEYFILAVNREWYLSYEGNYVNFKTTSNGTASITFMYEDNAYDIIDYDYYILDLIMIPRSLFKYEITDIYFRYFENPNQIKHDQSQEIIG